MVRNLNILIRIESKLCAVRAGNFCGFEQNILSGDGNAIEQEKLEDGSDRTVLRLPAFFPPIKVKVAVLPLMKKDGLSEKAREIYNDLKFETNCFFEEKDAIGKRYRRQDAIGTPYCITIDHQTLEDNTVTLRDRDTMKQERVSIDQLKAVVSEKTDWRKGLR